MSLSDTNEKRKRDLHPPPPPSKCSIPNREVEQPIEMRKVLISASVCTDASGFFNRGNQSWSPYTGVCFNLPPWLRNKFACLFMFGVMPIKIKNYESTYAHTMLGDRSRLQLQGLLGPSSPIAKSSCGRPSREALGC